MSIDGLYQDDNIFAKIIRGDLPCVKVFEDADILAFMDVFPQSRGHVLVIHKNERARNLLDVTPKGLEQVMCAVQNLAKAMNSALKPDGIIVSQFNGQSAGQTVFHLHVHIIPRYDGERFSMHASSNMADMDTLNRLAKRIRTKL